MPTNSRRANPRAAGQITYGRFPALREQMAPQLALDSMLELGTIYFDGDRIGKGYGYSDLESWQAYIDTVHKLGQIQNHYKAGGRRQQRLRRGRQRC